MKKIMVFVFVLGFALSACGPASLGVAVNKIEDIGKTTSVSVIAEATWADYAKTEIRTTNYVFYFSGYVSAELDATVFLVTMNDGTQCVEVGNDDLKIGDNYSSYDDKGCWRFLQ